MSLTDSMTNDEKERYIADHNRTHLIHYVGGNDTTSLEDLLLVVAKNIEEAMLTAGAEPGKDYTYRDLFTLSLPFAVDTWKHNRDKMSFSTDF